MKLAHVAKGKVRVSEFTSLDKQNLLDLFVNNEKTLLKIFEALFPNRIDHLTQSPQQKPSDHVE